MNYMPKRIEELPEYQREQIFIGNRGYYKHCYFFIRHCYRDIHGSTLVAYNSLILKFNRELPNNN